MATYTNLKKTHNKDGEIEFKAEIPADVLAEKMDEAAREAAKDLSLPGFRKGKVPEHIARDHFGEMSLLESAADEALHHAVHEITQDEDLKILGKPQLTITKIAPKNPLEFKIRFALYPDIALPDYKKIAREITERKDAVEITEKDIDEAIERLRTLMSGQMPPAPNTTDEEEKAQLPEVNDEFVQKLGPFKTVAEFRVELKKQLGQEKEINNKDLKRDEIIKTIVDKAKVKIPSMLVDQEVAGFADERDAELKRAGLSLEEYLKQVGKTQDGLHKEERSLIEDQIKTSLVFSEIRKKEDVKPNERDVQINIARMKLRYPERDERALRETAEALATQEKLFALLEGRTEKEKEDEEEAEDDADEPQD